MRIVLTTPVKIPAGWIVEPPTEAEAEGLIARGAAEAAPQPTPAVATAKSGGKNTGDKSAGS